MDFRGLMSCTETLGSESSDDIDFTHCCSSSSSSNTDGPSPVKNSSENRFPEKKQFPPPLTTMSQNGRRDFVFRKERKDGRLEIVKVAIERPEFLHASRQNGRLTLHLVSSTNSLIPRLFQNQLLSEEEFEEDQYTEEEEEEREWKILAAAGQRRCNQYGTHGWGQQHRRWVTTIM